MGHQRPHTRTRNGRRFSAGRGKIFVHTNRLGETFRFKQLPSGDIETLDFLGYKVPGKKRKYILPP